MDLQMLQGTIAVAVVLFGVCVFWLLKGWLATSEARRGGRPTWTEDAPGARTRQRRPTVREQAVAPTVNEQSAAGGTADDTTPERPSPERSGQ